MSGGVVDRANAGFDEDQVAHGEPTCPKSGGSLAPKLAEALREIAHSAECNGGGFLKRVDLLNVVRRHASIARAALAEWDAQS